jgi:hypothetical protein
MSKLCFTCVLVAFAVAVMGFSVPAKAQATRTWVSGVGDDANPCSRTAPCKTFAGAISKTAPFGEINCLDPGGFGALTITKSVTISCQAGTAGVLVSGTNGFIVNVGVNDRVTLDGLDIDGVTTGINGVSMIGAGKLIIRNCSIYNFSNFGVNIQAPAASPAPRVFLQNSLVTGNSLGGVNVQGESGAINNAFVISSLIENNGPFAVKVTGPSSLILSASVLSGSPSSIIVSGGGNVTSYGNNLLRNAGAPTQTLPLQ